jgi:hypothetical protein
MVKAASNTIKNVDSAAVVDESNDEELPKKIVIHVPKVHKKQHKLKKN